MIRKLVPIKNSVVCKRISDKGIKNENGILFKKDEVDIYEIIDVCVDSDREFNFKIGDKVMSCSIGDEIEINPNEIVYLFKDENIMCKVVD